MSDESNPLGVVEKAHEEAFFMRRNRELIAQMKERMAEQEQARLIRETTGVADEHILAALAHLGVTVETAPALHLVPLLHVAWADGEIQASERDLLLSAADSTGLTDGPARAYFESMLTTRPTDEFFAAALDFIGAILKALPPQESAKARDNLEHFAWRVADAAGGLFGLVWNVDDAEKNVLRDIARKLSDGKPEASSFLLSKLD